MLTACLCKICRSIKLLPCIIEPYLRKLVVWGSSPSTTCLSDKHLGFVYIARPGVCAKSAKRAKTSGQCRQLILRMPGPGTRGDECRAGSCIAASMCSEATRVSRACRSTQRLRSSPRQQTRRLDTEQVSDSPLMLTAEESAHAVWLW